MMRWILAGLLLAGPALQPAFAGKSKEVGFHIDAFGGIDDSIDSARIIRAYSPGSWKTGRRWSPFLPHLRVPVGTTVFLPSFVITS